MILSHYTIIEAKITIINKKLKEKNKYIDKYCLNSNSLLCKQHRMEIKSLYRDLNKLKKNKNFK